MAIIVTKEYQCDLCGAKSKNSKDFFDKWISFTVTDYFSMLDREYKDIVICPDCLKIINKLQNELGKY